MWPTLSAWTWWGIAAIVILAWVIFEFSLYGFRKRANQGSPSTAETVPEPPTPSISADGEEMAKHILLARDLTEADRLYTAFVTTIPHEKQFNAHFTNKAYLYRLDKAGEREKADAFYCDVASRDADQVGDAVRFSYLMQEIKGGDHAVQVRLGRRIS